MPKRLKTRPVRPGGFVILCNGMYVSLVGFVPTKWSAERFYDLATVQAIAGDFAAKGFDCTVKGFDA